MSPIFPALYDWVMRPTEQACLAGWRDEVLAPLSGTVLELGSGTGRNLGHYPPAVARLLLAEPDRQMRSVLAERVGSRPNVRILRDPAEQLSVPDQSVDAVVSTLVLCSVDDPERALGEVRRVLAPGGRLAFIEHVAAKPGSARLAWQGRLEPLWKRVAGNCHLTRDTADSIRRAGFEIVWLRAESVRKAMPIVRPSIRGIAVRVD